MLYKCNCCYCSQEFLASKSRIDRGAAKHCSRKCADRNRPKSKKEVLVKRCLVCDTEFAIPPNRLLKAKFCSKVCQGQHEHKVGSVERKCLWCDKSFRVTHSASSKGYGKFCSDECRLRRGKRGVYQPCPQCQTLVYLQPREALQKITKHCSKQCAWASASHKITRECSFCSETFFVPESRLKYTGAVFCSPKCRSDSQCNGKYAPCLTCGNEVYRTPRQSDRVFCSRNCRFKWYVGENCSTWRGGVTPHRKKIRDSNEYKMWRTAVFERDNYTCLSCGARSKKGW